MHFFMSAINNMNAADNAEKVGNIQQAIENWNYAIYAWKDYINLQKERYGQAINLTNEWEYFTYALYRRAKLTWNLLDIHFTIQKLEKCISYRQHQSHCEFTSKVIEQCLGYIDELKTLPVRYSHDPYNVKNPYRFFDYEKRAVSFHQHNVTESTQSRRTPNPID